MIYGPEFISELPLQGPPSHARIDVSGGAGVSVDRRLPEETKAALAAACETVAAEPVPYPMPFTIAGAVRRSGSENEGATEPEQPTSEAVSEAEV